MSTTVAENEEMPESPRAAAPAEPPSGRRRLLRALRGRPNRGQLIVAVLLALLGFAAAVQARSVATDDEYTGTRRADLIQLLDSLDAAEARAQRQLEELMTARDQIRSSAEQSDAAEQEAQAEAETLAILTGTVPVVGPGIQVTITDEDDVVAASTLLNAVAELRDAGAEAIQINEVSRVVAQSYFVDSERGIRVDGRELSRPFVIDVIGDSATLHEAVTFRGGLIDEVELLGGEVEAVRRERIEITALSDLSEPEYAQQSS